MLWDLGQVFRWNWRRLLAENVIIWLLFVMIFRQFLGLGIASPPLAATKKLSSSHACGGDSGCPGEDRE